MESWISTVSVLGFALLISGIQFRRAESRLKSGGNLLAGGLEARLVQERKWLFVVGGFIFAGAAVEGLVGDKLTLGILSGVGLTVWLIGCVSLAELDVRRGKRGVGSLGKWARIIAVVGYEFVALGVGLRLVSSLGEVVGYVSIAVLVIVMPVVVWRWLRNRAGSSERAV